MLSDSELEFTRPSIQPQPIMLRILTVTVALLAIAQAGVVQYPAGVSPHTCPNYPYCGVAVAHGAVGVLGYAAAYDHSGQHNPALDLAGQHNPALDLAGQHNYALDLAGQHNPALDLAGQHNPALDLSGQHNPALDLAGQHNPALDLAGQYNPALNYAGQYAHGGWAAPAAAWAAPVAWAAPAIHAARVPAGVSPHACPNYPYCAPGVAAHGHAW